LNDTERVVELLELIAKPNIDPNVIERVAEKIIEIIRTPTPVEPIGPPDNDWSEDKESFIAP
jgi:hypothetical protein